MSVISSCRCCLAPSPGKHLKFAYMVLGKTEIYGDMLKECFEINLAIGKNEGDGGICDPCVTRLRDACEFKQQVMRNQVVYQTLLTTGDVKEEISSNVKIELSDTADDPDDSDAYYLDNFHDTSMKDGHLLMTPVKTEDEKESCLESVLALDQLAVKKKGTKRKKSSDKTEDELPVGYLECAPLQADEDPALAAVLQLGRTKRKSKTSFKRHKANITKILKYSNCTPFFNKTLCGYLCAYCKQSYADFSDLKEHTVVHKADKLNGNKRIDEYNLSYKMDITDLKCTICNKNIDVIANLKTHLTNEHQIKFYSDVQDYILEFKITSTEILNCALCNSTFETFKMLLQHMNGHYRNYICEICDIGFINRHRLINHKRTHEIGTFKCSSCDKVFTTRIRKMCHEKYTHNTAARYTTNCPHCDQSFNSYYQRNRHMFKEHNSAAASYKCNICDKVFILKSKLTFHIKKVHLMERNHICAECGQGFFIKQSLDEHMIKHKGERIHQCTVCNKAYARKKTLREHMRIHNNDRRFKCGVCGLTFVQKCSLKTHILSNHGITLAEFESINAKTEVSGT